MSDEKPSLITKLRTAQVIIHMALSQLPRILIQELCEKIKMALLRSWEAVHLNKFHLKLINERKTS